MLAYWHFTLVTVLCRNVDSTLVVEVINNGLIFESVRIEELIPAVRRVPRNIQSGAPFPSSSLPQSHSRATNETECRLESFESEPKPPPAVEESIEAELSSLKEVRPSLCALLHYLQCFLPFISPYLVRKLNLSLEGDPAESRAHVTRRKISSSKG